MIGIMSGKKKVLVVCLAGARSLLQPEKKVQVICLAGVRSLLQAEKKKFKSSVWWVHNRYYDRKKSSSGCAITTISTTGPIHPKSSDFYAKLNVSNLNVTNLY